LRRGFKGLGFTSGVIRVDENDRESVTFRGHKMQRKLADITLKFFEDASKITGDQRLTSVGQNEKIRELGKETLAEIEKVKSSKLFFLPILQELERLEAEITPEATIKELSIADTLREIEARRLLLDMNPEERTALFFQAAETGDEVLYNAIMRAPKFLNMVLADENVIDKVKKIWAQKQNPELAKKYESVKEVHDMLQLNLNECDKEIRSTAGLPHKDFPGEVQDILDGFQE